MSDETEPLSPEVLGPGSAILDHSAALAKNSADAQMTALCRAYGFTLAAHGIDIDEGCDNLRVAFEDYKRLNGLGLIETMEARKQ